MFLTRAWRAQGAVRGEGHGRRGATGVSWAGVWTGEGRRRERVQASTPAQPRGSGAPARGCASRGSRCAGGGSARFGAVCRGRLGELQVLVRFSLQLFSCQMLGGHLGS